MPVLQLPALRVQVMTQVRERGDAQAMAQNGYVDVVGASSAARTPSILNVSAISVHPTVCTSCMGPEQLGLSQQGAVMFEFPASTYEFKHQPHLGMAVTLYINRGVECVQHSVAAIAYANFEKIVTGAPVQMSAAMNDVNRTPVTIVLQGQVTPQQQAWNHDNAALLQELCGTFNSIARVEERLANFSEERTSSLKNFLDPHNKDNVHSGLAMHTNSVRHVMNIDGADHTQAEFFKAVCSEECPDLLLKYAPLSAAMLFATAVKFLAAKDAGTQPLSYKSIADKLTSLRWTEQDAELWTQIFCNCVTSIVPAANTYTGDASWLVNADGARVISNVVGEEQLLMGSPVIQAVQDIDLCQHFSGLCQQLFSSGDLQKSELAFKAAHAARLKTCELGKQQDCEDFAADMRNYFNASTHAHVMTKTAEHMIGTALLCGDARLNLPNNTVAHAQQALLACCATQRHVRDLVPFACRDCVCIATGANLTSKYCASLDEKSVQVFDRAAFADRDTFLLTSTPGCAGHACRLRMKSAKMHTLDLNNDVKVHVHEVNVLCMQESTSSTIFRETSEPADVFDVQIQVGFGNTRRLSGMTRSLVRNVTGSIYGDMLTNSGLSASHAADRMGTKQFYKVLCAVGGLSVLTAEKGAANAPLQPADVLHSMLTGCKETQYYFGAENKDGAAMMALEFEVKPEEQQLLRLLARANAPVYAKSMQLVLAGGSLGSCFLPRLDSICRHMPGNTLGDTQTGKQLFVVAQKTPFLCMTDVVKSKSVDALLQAQKERVCSVLKDTCKTEFDFFSDHISTDIMLLHTHLSM